jgi:hypothetical protein
LRQLVHAGSTQQLSDPRHAGIISKFSRFGPLSSCRRVFEEIGPLVDGETAAWLERATAPI